MRINKIHLTKEVNCIKKKLNKNKKSSIKVFLYYLKNRIKITQRGKAETNLKRGRKRRTLKTTTCLAWIHERINEKSQITTEDNNF